MISSEKLFQNNIKSKYIIIIIILVGAILRLLYLNQLDDYYDDWNFFFTVDPNVSNEITWVRYFGDRRVLEQYNSYDYQKVGEDFPYYFAFFTKFVLKIFGYSVEKAHFFVLFFSIGSFFILTKICDLVTSDTKFKILTLFLFATNVYLIKDLNALRPHSLSIFLTLISTYYFILIYFKNNKSYKNLLIYCITTLSFLLIWPLNLAFFAGQLLVLIFICLSKLFKNYIIILIPSISIILLYLIFNHHYLEYQVVNKSQHYTLLNLKFFYSYFFNKFFGSILFGGFMLVLFSYYLIKDLYSYLMIIKKNHFNFFVKIKVGEMFIIIILSIYMLIITYSILRAPVMAAKYIPFLVPILLIWLSYKIYVSKVKIIYYLVILFSVLNLTFYWNDIQIDRPPIKKILKQIEISNSDKIFTTETQVFNHYLNNYKLSQSKNLTFRKFSDSNFNTLPNQFWFLCLNNVRFMIGDQDLPDEEKCSSYEKIGKFDVIKTIRMPDILLKLIVKD